MTIKDFHMVRSDELEPGDSLVTVLKVTIDLQGQLRLYRSPWPGGLPQGKRLLAPSSDMYLVSRVAYAVFPVLMTAPAINDDKAVCAWSQDADDWHTACNRDYPLNYKASIAEPNFSFCPGCGRWIEIQR